MKSTKTSILVIFGALVLIGCQDNLQQEGNYVGKRISVTAQSNDTTSTRTSLKGFETQWVAGDQIGIFSPQIRETSYPHTAVTSAVASAFDGEMVWGKGNHDFYSYYPNATGTFSHTVVPVSLPALQTQSAGGNSGHIAALDFMVADPLTGVAPGGEVSFQFSHLFTLLEFRVVGTGSLSEITLAANETAKLAFSGGNIDISQVKPAGGAPYAITYSGNASSSVTLSLASQVVLTDNDETTPTLYMMINPADLTGQQVSVTMTIDGTQKIITADGFRFDRGRKYILVIDPEKGMAEIEQKEREALIAIYNSTGGANWKNNTNWCSDKPIGEWYGVTTDSEGYVYSLSLNDNNLTGTIPAQIGDLSKLSYLYLCNGDIRGVIPKEIGCCTELRDIQIVNNLNLSGNIPVELFNCTQLNALYLSAVGLTGTIPAEIGTLKNLKYLSLSGTQLSGGIPKEIGDCESLESLVINGFKMNGSIPVELGKLKNLKWLDLGMAGLTGTIPAQLAGCINLESCNLALNNLSGTIPDEFGDISKLVNLSVWGNKLSGIIPESITRLKCWQYAWGEIVYNNYFDLRDLSIPAPDFAVKDNNGNIIDSSVEYAKNKYTILYQWNPGEMPEFTENLKNVYNQYKAKGIDVISWTWQDSSVTKSYNLPWRNFQTAMAENYFLKYSMGYTCYYPLFYVGFHTVVVIDSDKKVVYSNLLNDYNLEYFLEKNLDEDYLPSNYTSTDYSADGKVITLQKATTGNGVDIVLMGDAFSDRLIADGTYECTMRKAMEKFFTEEPYKTYRDFFNVYAVTAVSENEVYDTRSNTALRGYFGGGTQVGGNDGKCFYYALKAISASRLDDALMIVMMNSNNYAGTCYMYSFTEGDYARGPSVAYFPLGSDDATFEALLHHEANGHGFAKLADEYAYEANATIPEGAIDYYNQLEGFGWWKNVDFTNDPNKVKWAKFLTDNRYSKEGLGIYEGAFTYWTGAYRPTENSIMRHNYGGFNAPSREAIYYRIHKLAYGASWTYDYEAFVAYDAVNRTSAATTRRAAVPTKAFKPLAPPVIIKHSWRQEK